MFSCGSSQVSGSCVCLCLHPRLVKQFSSSSTSLSHVFLLNQATSTAARTQTRLLACIKTKRGRETLTCRHQGLEKQKVKPLVKHSPDILSRGSVVVKKFFVSQPLKIDLIFLSKHWLDVPSCLKRKNPPLKKRSKGKRGKVLLFFYFSHNCGCAIMEETHPQISESTWKQQNVGATSIGKWRLLQKQSVCIYLNEEKRRATDIIYREESIRLAKQKTGNTKDWHEHKHKSKRKWNHSQTDTRLCLMENERENSLICHLNRVQALSSLPTESFKHKCGKSLEIFVKIFAFLFQ